MVLAASVRRPCLTETGWVEGGDLVPGSKIARLDGSIGEAESSRTPPDEYDDSGQPEGLDVRLAFQSKEHR